MPAKREDCVSEQAIFGSKGLDRVKVKELVEWGHIDFVANKCTTTGKSENSSTVSE